MSNDVYRYPPRLSEEEWQKFKKRGCLFNYPPDVVAVINGHPITKADILANKRKRQARELRWKRLVTEPTIKPAFIWTFYNDGFPYGGWWLYILTARRDWWITPKYRNAYHWDTNNRLALQAMRLYPCGYLPMLENFYQWQEAFAEAYHRPTRKRPTNNGLALARAKVSSTGQLLEVLPF